MRMKPIEHRKCNKYSKTLAAHVVSSFCVKQILLSLSLSLSPSLIGTLIFDANEYNNCNLAITCNILFSSTIINRAETTHQHLTSA